MSRGTIRSNSTRPFYRVKVINGICSNTSTDEFENTHLLNVLNWSPLEDLVIEKPLTIIKEDDEIKSKNFYNAVQLSIELQKRMINLKSTFIDSSGHLINYSELRRSKIYNDLYEMSKYLTTISLDNVTENERKTFFINLYNTLTIHGIATLTDLPKSVFDLNQFWKTTAYKIGLHIYSLDDIEHGILRGNKPHSNCTQRHFTYNDPRARYSMRRCDPRIHFALNCGARSCPQISIYSSTNLEKALNMSTTSYCNSEIDLIPENAEIHLSKLFLWYKNDFGRTDAEVLRWIANYIDEPKQSLLKTILEQHGTKDGIHISYKIFDWMLNNHEALISNTTDVNIHQ
ncbi:unnamed protein product [Adineta steineri]|uniref:DUF547 domain-containing protein n=1 Tax=Adineta steineri TaxID=433720 RepID=A0A818QNA5_9BILA|nr:unnamed protein product [Adineta steineri]CAF1091504.1 unnamed protein product [Adineta steineri]CAF1124449.1 unnamed protein product [Adineta steineri]CAF1384854.1 unnamed protein product [Adineta steineri]CAF3598884.1 unnamed protein product [Adineta steineri]